MDTAKKNAVELKREVRRALGSYPKVTKVRVEDLECEGLMVAVRYHETDVVKLYLNKAGNGVASAVLNSGGWISKTTAERMNAVLHFLGAGFFVRFTYKRTKFVFTGAPREMGDTLYDQKFTLVGQGISMPFEDGMTFKRKGAEFVLAKPKKTSRQDDPPVCPYCKSDDHASYNCEERHR